MKVLFTYSDNIISRLIRKVTKEEISHTVIKIGDFVVHSNFLGLNIVPYVRFKEKNIILYSIDITDKTKEEYTINIVNTHFKTPYDFGALFFLGLRYLLPFLVSKQNLWQNTSMFLCTEFVSKSIYGKELSILTPYKLYLILKEEQDGKI